MDTLLYVTQENPATPISDPRACPGRPVVVVVVPVTVSEQP